MPLVDLQTNFKSLRFGKDTVGGGNSYQPFVVRKIPDDMSDVGRRGGPDFLLRGGALLPRIIANDTKRISKLFFPGRGDEALNDLSGDARRPVNLIGALFLAKQNVLSLTNVNSQAGYVPFVEAERDRSGNFFQRIGSAISTFAQNNIALNQGIYTPLSTIGQTIGGALGIHLNKQGLNPLQVTTVGSPLGNTPLGLPTYLNTIHTAGNSGNKSRLLGLIPKVQTNTGGELELYRYSGGPGAILGVGQTIINMSSDQRTGVNNKFNSQLIFEAEYNTMVDGLGRIKPLQVVLQNAGLPNELTSIQYNGMVYNPSLQKNKNIDDVGYAQGATIKYFSTLNSETQQDFLTEGTIISQDTIAPLNPSIYKSGTLESDLTKYISGVADQVASPQVFTQKQVEEYTPTSKDALFNKESFTKIIAPSGSSEIPNSLNYTNKNIEKRVNLGDPGRKGNLKSYTIGKRDGTNQQAEGDGLSSVKANSGYRYAVDKINALPIYQSKNVTGNDVKNDLVKFRIGVIDNDNPSLKNYLHFRAFINGFSDNFTADWQSQNYMGRGEKFYKYGGFDRQISLSWTVAAQSKQELIPMHQKLNYLASVTAPDYSKSGYMRGNLIELTVGGWCYNQVGIMTGLNLEIPEDSPWEIGIPDAGNVSLSSDGAEIFSDPSVKELPMIVNVSGFSFIPIHDFAPRIQQNKYKGAKLEKGGDFVSAYGKERYIGLKSSWMTNYGNTYGTQQGNNLTYIPPKD